MGRNLVKFEKKLRASSPIESIATFLDHFLSPNQTVTHFYFQSYTVNSSDLTLFGLGGGGGGSGQEGFC